MSPQPTGRVVPTASGADLILTRSYGAPIGDVWRSLTDPDSTARWFGRWEGEPGAGKTVRVQMAFEDDSPWCEMTIVACDPPRHLALSMTDGHGAWQLAVELRAQGETTELRFVQHLAARELAGSVGPGWEYYLDRLGAARDGREPPRFADYYPAHKAYYENQTPAA